MGLGWGAGGGGGAAWTPVQLQYDVDVRVVVHRRCGPGLPLFRADLPLSIFVIKNRAGRQTTQTQIQTQILDRTWSAGVQGLGFSRPRDNMELWRNPTNRAIEIETRSLALVALLSRALIEKACVSSSYIRCAAAAGVAAPVLALANKI